MIIEPIIKDFCLLRKGIEVKEINQKFMLTPVGDIHKFAPNHHDEKWKDWLKEAKANHTNDSYYLLMGDYIDFLSSSERMAYAQKTFHESTRGTLDDFVKDLNQQLIDELSFMKGNIIGIIEGNHHYQYQTGWTTTMQMCEQLDAPYMGTSGVIKLSFKYKGHSVGFLIFAHHGTGSGRLPGSTFNKVDQMREYMPACDLYIQNHDHKRGAIPVTALFVKDSGKNLRIRQKTQWLARGGSFLRAYNPETQSYIAKGAKRPTDLGTVSFELTFKSDLYKNHSFYIDTHSRV